jgi:hypothetical protein
MLALCVIALAVSTFFSPMVVLNPPLFGRTAWSPHQIALGIWERQLPVRGGHFELELIEIGFIYALLPPALAALMWAVNQRKALRIIGSIGFVPSFLGKFWQHAFMFTFGWQYWGSGHMQRGPAWWILPWIMPALLLISFLDLDRSESLSVSQTDEKVVG